MSGALDDAGRPAAQEASGPAGTRSGSGANGAPVAASWPAGVVAVLVVLGFLGALGASLWLERASEPALVMLGSLGAAFGAVVNYYLGSSLGSSRKTDLLADRLGRPGEGN